MLLTSHKHPHQPNCISTCGGVFFIFYTFMADPLVVLSFLRGWMVCVLWVFFGCFNLIVVFFFKYKKSIIITLDSMFYVVLRLWVFWVL